MVSEIKTLGHSTEGEGRWKDMHKKTTLFTNLYKGNSRKKREGQYLYCARQAMACQPVLTCSQSCPYTNSLFRAALIKIKSSISSSFRTKWEL